MENATQSTRRSLGSAVRAFTRADAALNRFLRYIHGIARRDACKGDLFIGWDRPTLRLCRPDLFARLVALEARRARELAWVRWYSAVPMGRMEFAA